MPRRSVRNVFLLGVLVGLIAAVVRSRREAARPAPAAPLAPPPAALPARAPQPAPVVVADPEPVAEPEPAAEPAPSEPVAAPEPVAEPETVAEEPDAAAWVTPVDGACPDGYPIKVKLSSGIFHRPGGLSYARTVPDRCYRDAASAEADGYRAAKR